MSDGPSSVVGMLGTLLGGSAVASGTSHNVDNSVSRSISTTASVGISLIVLRIIASAVQAAREDLAEATIATSGSNGDDSADSVSLLWNRRGVVFRFIRSFLHRMIVQKGAITNKSSEEEDEDNVPIIHEGSCHCQSVRFELIAPQKILCREGEPGKIQFRHARVRAKSFRLVQGTHLVKMYYYVNKPQSSHRSLQSSAINDDTGAHSFCSRCGVHFLHAPNSRSTALDINVDCFDRQDGVQIKVRPGKKTNLSIGVPLVGQWEDEIEGINNRYPETIAETSPMVLLPPVNDSSPFSSYQHQLLTKRGSYQEWSSLGGSFDINDDNTTMDLLPGWGKTQPDTPTTVYTSQTSRSGVPPTLTLDSTDCTNDSESVISLYSAKASFSATATTTGSSSARTYPASFLSSSSSCSAPHHSVLPTAAPLVRHQLHFYMRKHMSSSSSVSAGSSSPKASCDSVNSPNEIQSSPLSRDEEGTCDQQEYPN